ncbi:alpha/beta hydrolase [Vibrio crassostreae]|nr:alpha/beta hydrolase [Vibrio crassostreae]ROO49597.1 arylformamidase [Vibrio crassostreae]TCN04687.1 arylformamidase [Vibrio crassostreae]TCU06733.1 arylformamidase [Vibrio crassostreae]CAK2106776.1 arylformamidase [Vibrio crassostreae]CAK2885617.1 arylformamidase [Vibrio crassostreae]
MSASEERFRGMSQEELDREYSPSSMIGNANVFINQYIELSYLAKQDNLGLHENLSYGSDEDEVLDYYKSSSSLSPLFVFFHGGYWQELSKNESCFFVKVFQQLGIDVAVVNYCLCPKANLTTIIDQCAESVAWLSNKASEIGFDNSAIYLCGNSAGAHIVANLLGATWNKYGLNESPVAGACLINGIFDLHPVRMTYVNGPVQMTDSEVINLSPINKAVQRGIPLRIVYAEYDTEEFKRQSNEYTALLERYGYSIKPLEIRDRNHFDILFDLMDKDSILMKAIMQDIEMIKPQRQEYRKHRDKRVRL